jgi:predicted nucleotidyltransferase
MNVEPEIFKSLRNYFEEKPVLRAYIFGSHSRNEANENSDIDIYSKKIGLQFIQMKIDLERLLQKKVDLVSSGGLSPLVKPYIEKDKELIYER